MTQRLEGVEDTAFIDGKTQYGKLRMKEHTDDLNDELTFRGLEEFLLLGWKEQIKALKNHENEREPEGATGNMMEPVRREGTSETRGNRCEHEGFIEHKSEQDQREPRVSQREQDGARRSKTEPGGARRSQREPEGTRRNQREPEENRGSERVHEGTSWNQREPDGTRGNQRDHRNLSEPEGTRGNQREPEGTRGNQREPEGTRGNQTEPE